jgi:hypothetical protein
MNLNAYTDSVNLLMDHAQHNSNLDARIAARQRIIELAVSLHAVVEADASLKLSLSEKQERRARAAKLVKITTEGK